MIVRVLLSALALASLSCCAQIGALHTWNPAQARGDAERDIAAGRIRFAYIGGRASYPPGLPSGSGDIVRQYPRLAVGPQGCEQDSGFDIRAEYARRYNARMWTYVSSHPRSSNRAMQPTALRRYVSDA
jgi:hypothetical protein